jgi:uncharacterized protein YegL
MSFCDQSNDEMMCLKIVSTIMSTSVENSVSVSLIRVDDTKSVLQMHLRSSETKSDFSNCVPIVVLDKSGSMAGAYISYCVDGMKQLAADYFAAGCKKFFCVTFDDKAISYEMSSKEKVAEFNCYGSGGTNFNPAYVEIISSIGKCGECQPRVYFLTDGCGSSSAVYENQLKTALEKSGATIDVVGIGSHHDAILLNRLAVLVPGGTFQYATSAAELKEIVSKLLGVSVSTKQIKISIGSGKEAVSILRYEDDGVGTKTKSFSGSLMLEKGTAPPKTVNVKVDDKWFEVPVAEKVVTGEALSELKLSLLRNKLNDLAFRLSTLSSDEDGKRFDKELKEVDQEITMLSNVSNKDLFTEMSARERRKVLGSLNNELKQIVSSLYKGRSQKLTTHELATLLSHASSHITKNSLQKKLAQRVTNNADMTEKNRKKAEEIGSELAYTNAPDADLKCLLTLDNYQELSKSGDCLCLALKVSRKQAAVVDPAMVQIHGVFPSLVSFEAFRDAVEMQLLEGGGRESSNVHGGFDRLLGQSATVVKGLANEGINGVLPLYIDENHWKVASIRMKECLGWISTISWEGYSFAQVSVIPFAVLEFQLKKYASSPTEHNKKLVKYLEDICSAIMKYSASDEGLARGLKTHGDEKKETLENFIAGAKNRTVDVVSSLPTILATAHLLNMKSKELAYAYFEEGYRRNMWTVQNNSSLELSRNIASLLGIPTNSYTVLCKESTELEDEADLMKKHLQENGATISGGTTRTTSQDRENAGSSAWKWNNETLIEDLKINECRKFWTNNVELLFKGVDVPDKATILAVFVQNAFHRENSTRREAITSGEYENPFLDAAKVIQKYGEKTISILLEESSRNAKKSASAELARRFVNTSDRYLAAGLILKHVKHFGHHAFSSFARGIRDNETCPLRREKALMLVNGDFENVKIMKYSWKSLGGPGFNYRKIKKLIKN